ncbi:serine hydrolase domain-containing protein [Kordia zhangzhouensis]|uniref:serine hydrolase domain-containing protein n=1 Tax=Kordia zhangzhouensis TaxID=1620405 RepID=UPI0006294272|nr:serine hydrolase domain-containing protein [Kordia zhangzhouensis]
MKTTINKNIIRIFLLIGTLVSLYFVPLPIVKAWITPLPNTVQEQVNITLDYGFEGTIVYIEEKGKTPQLYAAGWKNRELKIPADPNALFKIASIGKLYTAVAITKLIAHGTLSKEGTIATYFPELIGKIENAHQITLRMLVQHRSGIPSFTNTPNFWTNPPKNKTETLERIAGLPANFAPDTSFEYSNTNYLLLSMLVEKTVGYSEFQYIQEQILQPLGLENTFKSIHEVVLNDVMSGYYVGVKEDIKTTDYGSMIATAADVGAFIRALNDGTLFQHNERALYASLYKFEHTGLIPGYQSIAKYHKDIDTVVVQFTNTTNFDGYEWSLFEIAYSRIVKIIRKNRK